MLAKSSVSEPVAGHTNAVFDARLQQRIVAYLPLRRNGDGHKDVQVAVEGGFVTLSGSVRTYREKVRLHRFVMGLKGVRALRDLLQVQPPESLKDREVALLVRQALDAHSALPPGTASVHIDGGVCTLTGSVRSAEERHVAEVVANNCRGVKAVVNKLAVNRLDELSDAATARVVKAALAYCADFDADGVTISCANGTVLLRGQVPTLLDRSMVEEIARLQPGVRLVDNHLQVGQKFILDESLEQDSEPRRRRRPTTRGD